MLHTTNPMTTTNDKSVDTLEGNTSKSPKLLNDDIRFIESLPKKLFRRCFANIDVYVMIFNTFSTIVSLAQAASTGVFPSSNFDSNEIGVGSTSGSTIYYYQCINGNVMEVDVFCPYETNSTYQSLIALWVIFFVILVFAKVFWTFPYATNDLRFFIATDKFNSTRINKFLMFLASVLTIASGLAAIYYSVSVGNSSGVQQALIFIAINIVSLKGLTKCSYDELNKMEMLLDFPSEIVIHQPEKKLSNLYGLIINQADLYQSITTGLLTSKELQSDAPLREFGDPKALEDAMVKLIPLKRA